MYSVLYVDDEVDLHDIVAMYLEETGLFQVHSVVSASLAEQFLATTRVDAIISDYQMPKEDGIDFLKYVRKNCGNIPFILFSGKGREEVVIDAINNGANFYLQKGGDPDSLFAELIHKLKTAILQRHDRETLRKSVELQTRAESIGHIGSWEYDAGSKKIWASDESLRIFGFGPDNHELTIEQVESVMPDRERVRKVLVDLIQVGSDYRVEYIIHPADGAPPRVIRSLAEPERDEQGNIKKVRGILLDISERKRAEDAIAESEKKYRVIFEQTGTAMIIVEEDETISLANNEFVRLSGYGSDEISGCMKFWDFVDPLDRNTISEYASDVRSGPNRIPPKTEIRFIDKHGQKKNILLTLGLIPGSGRIVASLLDITDRKLLEDEIKKSERNYRAIIDNIHEGYYRGSADGILTAISPSGAKILGYDSAEELIGKPVDSFIYGNPRQRDDLLRIIEQDGEIRNAEVVLRKKDGTCITIVASSHRYFDHEGNYSGVEGFFRDISGYKEIEENLRESEEQFRLKLDAFLSPDSDMSDREFAHILNTPLIRSLAEELQQIVPLAVAILDLNGNILMATGWQDICTKFHRVHEPCRSYCHESDRLLSRDTKKDEFVVCRCGNGLWDMVTPIHIGDRHVGNLYAGQFFYDDMVPDPDQFAARAEQYGFDKDAYLEALGRVPRLNRDLANRVMKFCTRFASVVSFMCYSNLKLAKSIASEKRITDALRSSESRNTALLKAIPDTMFIISRNGEYCDLSIPDPSCSVLPPDTYIGKNIRDTGFQAKTIAEILDGIREVLETRALTTIEYELFHPQGPRIFEARLVPLNADEVLGIVRDITGRKQQESAIQNSADKYRYIIETAREGIWILDVHYRTVYANEHMASMLGYTTREMTGKLLSDFIHPEDALGFTPHTLQKMHGNGSQFERKYQKKDGSTCWGIVSATPLFEEGKFTGSFGMVTDITDRKLAEEKLRQQNEFFQLLIDTIPNPVYYKDAQLVYLGCNRAFEEFFEVSRHEIIGKNLFDLFPKEQAVLYAGIDEDLLKKPRTDYYEISLTIPDGSRRQVLINASTFLNPDGSVGGILGVIVDISELSKARLSAQQANRKLNLLASITRHDILNKVTVIIGKLRAAKKQVHDPLLLADLGKIESATKTIRAQIDFSRVYQDLGTLDPQWQDLDRLLAKFAVPGEIRMDIRSDNVEIYADPMLEKVFHNLFENTLLHGRTATAVRIYWQNSPGGLILYYEDNGIGIPHDEKERIFEGGYGRAPGHGLFLVREILGITGISIQETGTGKNGARFEILIPEHAWRKKTRG